MTAWNVSHLRPSALINMLKFLRHVKEKKNDIYLKDILFYIIF